MTAHRIILDVADEATKEKIKTYLSQRYSLFDELQDVGYVRYVSDEFFREHQDELFPVTPEGLRGTWDKDYEEIYSKTHRRFTVKKDPYSSDGRPFIINIKMAKCKGTNTTNLSYQELIELYNTLGDFLLEVKF